MANYSTLKASVNAYIKANGVRAITGPVLNGILTQMINTLGDGARYGGIATPSGNPGTHDNVVFYLAFTAGTYTNYGGVTLDGSTLHVFVYDGTWADVDTGVPTSTAFATKADKDEDAVEGNIAMFDSNGNPVDGGVSVDALNQLGQEIETQILNFLFGGEIYNLLFSVAKSGYVPNTASSGTLPEPVSSDTVKYIFVPVLAGETFNVTLFTGNDARAYTLTDKNKSILKTAVGGGFNLSTSIVVEQDGYILFNLFSGVGSQHIDYSGYYNINAKESADIAKLKESTEYYENLDAESSKNALYEVDGTEQASQYKTHFFPVSQGDILKVTYGQFPSEGYSVISAWNGNTFLQSLLNTPVVEGTSIVVAPENCTHIGVSLVQSVQISTPINEVVKNIESQEKISIKCLFIGNSVSQDHVSYLPWLLKNTYPNVYFEIYQAYCGGKTIKEYVTDIIPNNRTLDIFSEAKNVAIWTNRGNVTFDGMFDFATFDLICFEGYFHQTSQGQSDEDTAYFEQLIDYIRTKQEEPFKLAYLLHQQYDDVQYNVLDKIINAARFAIQNNEVTMLFPCGIVTELVKTSFGTSFLTPDLIHNNQGLPCIMGAYTLLGNIAKYLGLKDAIINNQNRITPEIEQTLNIPGPNGSLKVGTEQQYKEAQTAAVMAIKYGNYLTIDAASSIIQINP